jgi:outer membrane usher protein
MSRSHRDLALLSVLGITVAVVPARAQQSPAGSAHAELYLLDVQVNGWPLGLVARFVMEGGRLRVPAEQFDGLGFAPNLTATVQIGGERWVWLDRVAGLNWTLDQRAQTIDFATPPRLLKTTELHVAPGTQRIAARADWGAVLAWDAFAQWSPRNQDPLFARSFSVNLDARLFSPLFTAASRGVIYGGAQDGTRLLRLESYADFDDTGHSRRVRIGDSFTAGPVWLRTLRFGGLQWGSDFGVRPDLVTMPVPSLAQEVSVPSTVDLFVNGVQRYSNSVTPGPLRLSDLPIVTGTNIIRTVITDPTGRRTELTLPFYASNDLLVQGMTDFSVAAGFPRQNYGVASNDYGPVFGSLVASYGVTDKMTLRAYAAGAMDYWTAAAGATAQVGGFIVLDGALLGGRAGGESGWAFYASASRTTPHFNIAASYARGFSYTDLSAWFGYVRFIEAARASAGLNFGNAGQFNLLYSRERNAGQSLTNIVSGTYGIDFGGRRKFRISVSGYADTGMENWGGMLSVAVPLGRNVQGYMQQAWRGGRPSGEIQIQGADSENRLNWQVNASGGADQPYAFDAYASWDGRVADLFARATRVGKSTGIQAEIAQSLVLMGGEVFLTGRVDDGFTVVDTGLPGVRVTLENRPVGQTGKSGQLLVTGLQSYLPNAIAIDLTDLPIDAAITEASRQVAPRGSAGMVTRFDIIRARSAIVVLERADGKPPPAGARVQFTGSNFTAPLGFGGEVYVRGLQEGENRLDVIWHDGKCTARFAAPAIDNGQPRLGPYLCVP